MNTSAKDGVPIAFDVKGHGRPIVLLHGYLANRRCWADLRYVDALNEAGRQCISIDARGHGESGKPDDAEAYAQAKRAGDVVAVLDHLGIETADIFGFSMGGWIAIGAAQTHPNRVRRLLTIGAHRFFQSMKPFRDAVADDLSGWIDVVEKLLGRHLSASVRQDILSNDIKSARACVARDRESTASMAFNRPWLALAGQLDPLHDEIKASADAACGNFHSIEGRNHITSLIAIRTVVPRLIDFLNCDLSQDARSKSRDFAGLPL